MKLAAASARVIAQIAAANREAVDSCLDRLLAAPRLGTCGTKVNKGELIELDVTGTAVPALDLSSLRYLARLKLTETSTHTLVLPRAGTLVELTLNSRKGGVRTVEGLAKQRLLRTLSLHRDQALLDVSSAARLQWLWIRGAGDLKLGSYPDLTYAAFEGVANQTILDLGRSKKLELLALIKCRALHTIRLGSRCLTHVMIRGCPSLRHVDATAEALAASAALRKLSGASSNDPALRLHERLRTYNWDDGTHGVLAIVRNKNCALSTAQLAYWLAQPAFYQAFETRANVPAHARDGWSLLEEIERRVERAAYLSRSMPWTAAERKLVSQARKPKWEIPRSLFPTSRRSIA